MSLPFLVRAMVRDARTAGRTIGLLYGVNVLGAAWARCSRPGSSSASSGIRGRGAAAAAAATSGRPASSPRRGAPARGERRAAEEAATAAAPAARAAPARASGPLLYALSAASARCPRDALVPHHRRGGQVHRLHLRHRARASTCSGIGGGQPRRRRHVAPLRAARCARSCAASAAILVYAAAAVRRCWSRCRPTRPLCLASSYWGGRRRSTSAAPGAGRRCSGSTWCCPLAPVRRRPRVLMGFSFIALQRAVHDDLRTSGRKVGLLQAANIAGCVAGSLLVGLVALDRLGTRGHAARCSLIAGLVFAAVLALAAAAACAPVAGGPRSSRSRVAVPGQRRRCGCGCTASGRGAAHGRRRTPPAWPRSSPGGGTAGSVWVNGRTNSSLPFGGIHTALGAAPALMHPAPREVGGHRPRLRRHGVGRGLPPRDAPGHGVRDLRAAARACCSALAREPQPPAKLPRSWPTRASRIVVADGRNALERSAAALRRDRDGRALPDQPLSRATSTRWSSSSSARAGCGRAGSCAPGRRAARRPRRFVRGLPLRAGVRRRRLLVGSNDRIAVDLRRLARRARSPGVRAYLGEGRRGGSCWARCGPRAP